MIGLKWSLLIHVILIATLLGLSNLSETPAPESPIEITDLIHAARKNPRKASSNENASRSKTTAATTSASESSASKSNNSNTNSGSPDGVGEAVAEEFEISSLPLLVNEVRVPYPPEARASGIQGAVQFDLIVSSTGKVADAKPIGNPPVVLMNAAKKAILQFQFKPAVMNAKPVAVRIRYTYRFILQ